MDWTNPAAEKLLQRWQGIWSFLQDNILRARSALLTRPGPDSDLAPVPLRMAGVGGVAGAASGGGVRGASESRALTAKNDDIIASVPED